jgi:hypothetical protein
VSGEVSHGLDEQGRAQMRAWVYEHIDDLYGALAMAGLDDAQMERILALVMDIERELGRRP